MRFNHGHLSGFWNVDLAQFIAADLKVRQNSHIVTYTETTKDTVVAYLRGVRGWEFSAAISNNTGECAVGWRTDRFKRLRTKTYKLTDMTVRTDTGALRPPVVLRVVWLRDKITRSKLIIGVVHMVSSVETALFKSGIDDIDQRARDHRADVWLDCARSLRTIIRRLVRWNPKAVIRIGGDMNLDHHRAWVRDLTEQIGLDAHIATFGPHGTLGGRLIDIFRDQNIRKVTTRMFDRFEGFDHKGWMQEITT